MTASVNNLTGKVHAGMPQMRQIGRRLVAWGGWIAAFCWRSDQLRSARVHSSEGRGPTCSVTQLPQTGHPISKRRLMRSISEDAGATEADRLQCRALIEAAGFHAVDYEEDGAAWERMLPADDCLVLTARETALFGKPERKDWTLTRFLKDGTPGGFTQPVTLGEALDVSRTLSALPRFAWRLL